MLFLFVLIFAIKDRTQIGHQKIYFLNFLSAFHVSRKVCKESFCYLICCKQLLKKLNIH